MSQAAPVDVRPAGRAARAPRPGVVPRQPGAERPASTADLVARQRLLNMLSEGARRQLTLISAPVGYGKSALLQSWLAAGAVPGPVVRLVCAECDLEPEFFWRHVLSALVRDVPSLRQATLDVGLVDRAAPQNRLPPDPVDRMARVLGTSNRPVLFVVDEAERLGLLVLEDLEELLRRAGSRVHLVLAGRETPLMRPPLDAARGSLARITRHDLAFTAPEAAQLLEGHGVCVSEAAVTDLVTATQGWPAVLARATTELAASQSPASDLAALLQGRALTDGPLTDVLDAQPPQVRSFLLTTSVVDHLWPGLATALSGEQDAAGLLGALLRANLFLGDSSESGRCYTYEPMFRALLRSRLEQEAPQEVARLHVAAAGWLQGTGRLTEAAVHLARVGRWNQAAALVVEDLRVGDLVWGVGPLPELFAGMPESVTGPEARVVRASLPSSREDQVEPADLAEAALAQADDASLEHLDPLLLSIGVLEVQSAAQGSDADAGLRAAHTAKQLLAAQPSALVGARPEVLATLLAAEGAVHLREGNIEDAVRTLTEGLVAARGKGCAPVRLTCESRLAITEAVRGRLGRAEQHAAAAEALARTLGATAGPEVQAVRVARAWVHTERYAVRRARRCLQGVPPGPVSATDPVVTGAAVLLRSRLARAEGDLRGAVRTIAQVRSQHEVVPLPTWLDQRLRSTAASLLAASHGGADVAPLPDASGAPVPVDLQVESWLRRANRALSRGETRRARSALEQALQLAESERLRRPVAEAPQPLRQFLFADNGLRARRQWLGPATASGEILTTVEDVRPAVVEALTAKESEVLGHLSALLSTEEIAETMFVSVNTVRSHVRSILRKLSATRRNEAVRHARDLGLISR